MSQQILQAMSTEASWVCCLGSRDDGGSCWRRRCRLAAAGMQGGGRHGSPRGGAPAVAGVLHQGAPVGVAAQRGKVADDQEAGARACEAHVEAPLVRDEADARARPAAPPGADRREDDDVLLPPLHAHQPARCTTAPAQHGTGQALRSCLLQRRP